MLFNRLHENFLLTEIIHQVQQSVHLDRAARYDRDHRGARSFAFSRWLIGDVTIRSLEMSKQPSRSPLGSDALCTGPRPTTSLY